MSSPVIEDSVLFGKVVTFLDPDQIRVVNGCPDLNRLDDPNRLGAATQLFQNSAFLSNAENYPAFISDDERDAFFTERLDLMEKQIAELVKDLTKEEVKEIIRLVKNEASDDELLTTFARFGGGNKFAQTFKVGPEHLALGRAMPLVNGMLIPGNIFTPKAAIEAHKEVNITASGNGLRVHNPIASTLLCTDLIRRTVLEPDVSVNTIITDVSPLQETLRLTVRETDLCGFLPSKVPANTIVLLFVGVAAKESRNSTFTFGHCRSP